MSNEIYRRVEADPAYQQLVQRRGRLAMSLSVTTLVAYYAFMAVVAFAPHALSPTIFEGGTLTIGAPADVCVFDPAATWQLTPEALKSRGKNSPWTGYMMTGKVKATLVAGRPVYLA